MAATALRPAVVDFMRLATTSERLDLAAEQIEIGEGAPFVGPEAARHEPPAGVRRHRRGHQARGGAHAVQPLAGRLAARWAISWSCSAMSISSKRSKSVARGTTVQVPGRTGLQPRPMTARRLDGAGLAARSALSSCHAWPRSRRGTAGLRDWRSSLPAAIRRRRSTCATSSRPLRKRDAAASSFDSTATRRLDDALSGRGAAQRGRGDRRDPRAVAAAGGDGSDRRAARVRHHRSREGRRRLSSGERRPARAEAADAWSRARRSGASSCSSASRSRSRVSTPW